MNKLKGVGARMNNTDLFSIGEFAKLTGVSIKALHYYEKIHILKPAYIDAGNNYRYYHRCQIHQVALIELLLDLGIRLNLLPQYVSEDFAYIDYEKLLADGKCLAQKKLEDSKKTLTYIDYLEAHLNTEHSPVNENAPSYLPSVFRQLPQHDTRKNTIKTNSMKF